MFALISKLIILVAFIFNYGEMQGRLKLTFTTVVTKFSPGCERLHARVSRIGQVFTVTRAEITHNSAFFLAVSSHA